MSEATSEPAARAGNRPSVFFSGASHLISIPH
jgi:hypothetical protein